MRSLANDAAGVETVVGADVRQAGEINVWADHAPWADLHAFVNHRVWANPDGWVHLRPSMDNGRRMNHAAKGKKAAPLAKPKAAPSPLAIRPSNSISKCAISVPEYGQIVTNGRFTIVGSRSR